jgi:hypothetical protein
MDEREMLEKSADFIESECLRVARLRLGCGHLEAVRIEPTKPSGSGPNWDVAAFEPELLPIARAEAMDAIQMLRGTYALARKR